MIMISFRASSFRLLSYLDTYLGTTEIIKTETTTKNHTYFIIYLFSLRIEITKNKIILYTTIRKHER